MIKPSKEFLEIFKGTDGALSVAESIAIINIASQAPSDDGFQYAEFGTYKGKSAISALYGLDKSIRHNFYLLEPEFLKILFLEETEQTLKKVCRLIDTMVLPCYVASYSTEFIEKLNEYSYVFIDSGSHQDGLPMREVKLLEDRVVKNGIVAFHDCFAQFIEVTEAYNYLISTGKYEPININWDEINSYVNQNNLNQNNSSWHHTELENPNFIGALKRK